MSIGFVLDSQGSAVIWRGPKKNAFIKQMLQDVCWGSLDYLIIDTPPGTSDEHISIAEYLKSTNPDGAVVVTTPQMVSLNDVRKEITFCRKLQLPILGLVENMSGFRCPTCAECTNIFSSGGGKSLAELTKIPFIGKIPIDPSLTLCAEEGKDFVATHPESDSLKPLEDFATNFEDFRKLAASTLELSSEQNST